jgi:hypothetical protein
MLCTILVVFGAGYSAHAMVESALHADGVPHTMVGIASEDHGPLPTNHGHSNAADDSHHPDDGVGTAEHDQGVAAAAPHVSHGGAVGHHHHTDHTLDPINTAQSSSAIAMAWIVLRTARQSDEAKRRPPPGIERPPRV